MDNIQEDLRVSIDNFRYYKLEATDRQNKLIQEEKKRLQDSYDTLLRVGLKSFNFYKFRIKALKLPDSVVKTKSSAQVYL